MASLRAVTPSSGARRWRWRHRKHRDGALYLFIDSNRISGVRWSSSIAGRNAVDGIAGSTACFRRRSGRNESGPYWQRSAHPADRCRPCPRGWRLWLRTAVAAFTSAVIRLPIADPGLAEQGARSGTKGSSDHQAAHGNSDVFCRDYPDRTSQCASRMGDGLIDGDDQVEFGHQRGGLGIPGSLSPQSRMAFARPVPRAQPRVAFIEATLGRSNKPASARREQNDRDHRVGGAARPGQTDAQPAQASRRVVSARGAPVGRCCQEGT